MHFIAKPSVPASDALEAAITGPTIGECGMACQLARYGALLDVLGRRKFDQLFSEAPINIGYLHDNPDQPMRLFVGFTKNANERSLGSPNQRPVKRGHLVFFRGVPDYTKKHPFGTAQSENVICTDATPGHQRFAGLSYPEEISEEIIDRSLLDSYNLDATDPFTVYPQDFHITLCQQAPWVRALATQKATGVLGYDAGSPQGFKLPIILGLDRAGIGEITIEHILNHPLNRDWKTVN